MILFILSLACFYLAALAAYRLFVHPLHKYPGPTFAALTLWYEAYYDIVKGGGLIAELERLHKKYGPVVRIAPNTLHFNDRRAFHDIYGGSTLIKWDNYYQGISASWEDSSFAYLDPHKSKIRRGLLNPLFSRRAVLALENTVQKQVDKFISVLLAERDHTKSKSIDMTFAYRSLTTDIITSYCFAKSPNTLDAPDFSHFIITGIRDNLNMVGFKRHFPRITCLPLKAPEWVLLRTLPKLKGYAEIKKSLEMQIDGFLKDPSSLADVEHETIFHHLIEPKADKGDPDALRPSRRSLIDEAFTLIGAGGDTVGNTLTVGTFHALKDESICRRLVAELREAWPDVHSPMVYASLEKLPYLTAFIKESLRVSVGVIHPLPRVITSPDTQIGELKLPVGTVVEMSTFFMLSNPEVFHDPDTFDPSRWLAADAGELMQDLLPFSKGPRMCLGINLAWCELYLIFGNVFRKLDMKLDFTEDTIDSFTHGHLDFFTVQWPKGYRTFVGASQDYRLS